VWCQEGTFAQLLSARGGFTQGVETLGWPESSGARQYAGPPARTVPFTVPSSVLSRDTVRRPAALLPTFARPAMPYSAHRRRQNPNQCVLCVCVWQEG